MLKDFSYNVIRLPRTNVRPLQILEKRGSDLVALGEITDLFQAGSVGAPVVGPDEQAGFINGKRTRDLDLNVGLTLLGGIIGAMTGAQAKVSAAYKKASALAFEFDDVMVNQVNQIAVNKFLAGAKVDAAAGSGLIKALNEDRLYVITSTIKSKKFTTEAVQSSGTAVGVDVPVIKAAVGGSVGIKVGGANNSKVTYSGGTPLVFGFQAARMEFESDAFLGLKQINPEEGALRLGQPAGAVEPVFEMLETAGPFVSFKEDLPARPKHTVKKGGTKKAATSMAKKGALRKAPKSADRKGAKSAPKKVAKKSAKNATKKQLPQR
jgi:hypothetical protein